MHEVTRLLEAIDQGDSRAADRLLPVVYDELRRLAASKLAVQPTGQTLQATALVHEAYLKLVGNETGRKWNSQQHFFAAAAQAMRWILVDNARRKQAARHGGDRNRADIDLTQIASPHSDDDLLAINEALEALAAEDDRKARLVDLRYFGGLTNSEVAELLGVSQATVERDWAFAKGWLHRRMTDPVWSDNGATPPGEAGNNTRSDNGLQ